MPNWRRSAPHSTRKNSRTGSSSPHREKKKADGSKSQPADNQSQHSKGHEQAQPSLKHEHHNKCRHHKNGHQSNPTTPHSSGLRKKSHSLQIEDNNMSRSPSAPNLHATATSMLALQGSLTAFTAMAVGKDLPRKLSHGSNQQPRKTTCKVVVTTCQESEGKENFESAIKINSPVSQSPPQCTCHQRALSPVPRLNMHAHVPEEKGNYQDAETWIEREPVPTTTSSLLSDKAFPKNAPYKETSV